MAIATWELQTTTGARRHPAGTRRAAAPVRPSPARRPAPPTAEHARAATRGVAAARLRRGLAMLALLVIAVGVGTLLAGGGGSPAAALEEAREVRVVVGTGDTVWGLVMPHVPAGMHPQEFVAEVLKANDLDAAAVVPGTVVRIPLR